MVARLFRCADQTGRFVGHPTAFVPANLLSHRSDCFDFDCCQPFNPPEDVLRYSNEITHYYGSSHLITKQCICRLRVMVTG